MQTKADRIRFIREKLFGEDRGDFAKRFGVKLMSVCHWESETKPSGPGAKILEQIAETAGVELYWIKYGRGETPAPRFPVNGASSATPIEDTTLTDSWRNPAILEILDIPTSQALIRATVQNCYVRTLNRLPTEAEMVSAVKSSLELFEAQTILESFQRQVGIHQTQLLTPNHTDETKSAP